MKCKFCNKDCYIIDHDFINVDNACVCSNHEGMIVTFWYATNFIDTTFFIDKYEFSCSVAKDFSKTGLFQYEVSKQPNYVIYQEITFEDILYETMGFKSKFSPTGVSLPKKIAMVDYDFGLTPDNVRFYIDKLLKMSVFS